MKLVTILVPLLAATVALAAVRPSTVEDEALDRAAIEAELDVFVERYLEAFEKADPDAIRAVCSTSSSFAWYENGKLRYPSVDRILTVLSQMPPGMRLETVFSDQRTRVLTADIATVAANFETTGSGPMSAGDSKAFRTEGVVTLFLEREEGSWKIALGHTSARFGDR